MTTASSCRFRPVGGSVKLECEGGTIYDGDVRPGMLRIMSPGERLRVERRSRAEAVVVSVPGPLFRRIAEERGYLAAPSGLTFVAPIVDPNPHVERLTSSLLGLKEVDANLQPMFLEGITLALLALAFAPCHERGGTRRRPGLSKADLTRCIDFAEANLCDKLDLASWAAALGLSLSEFVRRFQQTMHVAPYTWFLNRRVDRAKALLEDPDVALSVGFCSQSHFSEAFRRRTGASPGEWRKQFPSGIR
ncbi:AraC family transcriptional regulator [Lichenifustis flavocetrariae]|uniref:AraC family transcriptional regulator n=1 Tax=Lichenifustis flavocetrariae TaxID=2949735 RepID=A0AA41YV98_9HYPH|nr:AraC family transcriptional regulator [Lichenifustis flavocetrariae]MCW6507747.1 AraC family transcriptional regulator [Lichenifustis flavocetrariae]